MSKIEWTDKTWNPIVGCTIVSPGCTNCYAMKMAARIELMGGKGAERYAGTTKKVNGKAVWTGLVNDAGLDVLLKPMSWKKPQRIFVNSMSDLFHEDVTDAQIDAVMGVIAETPHHTYQVFTKRSARMRSYMNALESRVDEWNCNSMLDWADFPLKNLWLGVSIEDQKRLHERLDDIVNTSAAVRAVSAEPLLGPLEFGQDMAKLDWVIVGGESGHNARPMNPQWARDIRDQALKYGVAFNFKQNGEFVSVSEVEGPGPHYMFLDGRTVRRTGKKKAGRTLDGKVWDQYPDEMI